MISDEQLQAFKELMESTNETEPQSDLRYQNFFYMAIVKELQQHREEKRWRKAQEEAPEKPCMCILSQDGKIFIGLYSKYGAWHHQDGSFVPFLAELFWRPQLTDLPEGE